MAGSRSQYGPLVAEGSHKGTAWEPLGNCMKTWANIYLCWVIIGGSDMINSRWWYNGFVSGLVSTVKLKFSTCLLVPFLRKASAGWRGAGRSSPSSPTSASPSPSRVTWSQACTRSKLLAAARPGTLLTGEGKRQSRPWTLEQDSFSRAMLPRQGQQIELTVEHL